MARPRVCSIEGPANGRWRPTGALAAALALAACDGQDTVVLLPGAASAGPGVENHPAPLAPAASPGAAAAAPFYVLANEVYDADGSTSYVHVLPSLDVTSLDESRAVEYAGGRATIQAYAGWLFVAGPESPVISRFSVDSDGTLTAAGELSFGNYAFQSVVIDDWSVSFIDPHEAYLLNGTDGSTVIWDPTDMEIIGEVDQSRFDLSRPASWTLNFSPGVVQGKRLLRTLSWDDWDAGEYSLEQFLAIYDLDTDELVELVPETRCPSLGNRVNRDEAGNLYFSNWIWNVGESAFGGGTPSCVRRMAAGTERFDDDWSLEYSSVTRGREAAMFTYLAGGDSLISVFHAENVPDDAELSPPELVSTNNWRVWSLDLASRDAAPVEGLPWMAGAASTFRFGDRTFIFVPADDWSVTHVYEIADGRAQPRFDVRGWSFQLVELR